MDSINNKYLEFDKENFKKDCPNYPYLPPILPPRNRIIVIGDLHGDYKLTIKSLELAKVIDNNGNWIGGETAVVQVGDQIDRCRPSKQGQLCDNDDTTKNDEASEISILKLMTKLHSQAIEKGGLVISLLGNHELMNTMAEEQDANSRVKGKYKNLNYVSKKGLDWFLDKKNYSVNKTFNSGKEARAHAFAPGNEYGKFMGCTRLASVIIGNLIFVHAGIIKSFSDHVGIKHKGDMYKINFSIRKWLNGDFNKKTVVQWVSSLIHKNYINQIVNNQQSMFWTRILGRIPPNLSNNHPDCMNYLAPALRVFEVGENDNPKMFIGHTPQFDENNEGINSTCDKKLWRVDIGGSGAFDEFDKTLSTNSERMKERKVQVLEITGDADNKPVFTILKL